jgi:hypothetical protein
MTPKEYDLLTNLLKTWDTWKEGLYEEDWERFTDILDELKERLEDKELVDRDVWSELYAKNKVFDELAEEIREEAGWAELERNKNMVHAELNRRAEHITVPLTPFEGQPPDVEPWDEGHPPGNPFEDEQTIALMNGDDLTDYRGDK